VVLSQRPLVRPDTKETTGWSPRVLRAARRAGGRSRIAVVATDAPLRAEQVERVAPHDEVVALLGARQCLLTVRPGMWNLHELGAKTGA
jgi:hypothetical protein